MINEMKLNFITLPLQVEVKGIFEQALLFNQRSQLRLSCQTKSDPNAKIFFSLK